ncbi:hypothetical protein LTR05_005314 [Lithohypha guttulata]|uniref:Uncharacterized protein n=1 Tax=Lithohypha guttulata TaxID=1690604 RepID=A0AAN7YFS5_9EURO|nr:hypothetical protein LTR05_005314 [Lithohypha guttulata]
MRLHDPIMSEYEFEQLPPTLQRKYFSSLERLRLVHDAENSKAQSRSGRRPFVPQIGGSRKPSVSSAASTDRSFSTTSHPRARSSSHLRKASRKATTPTTTLTNPWGLAALPAAILRKQFSTEEQYHIAGRLNLVILDATDEALYKQYHQRINLANRHSLDLDLRNGTEGYDSEEEEDVMDPKDFESFRWLDQDNELDLRLDDYHAISSDLSSRTSPQPAFGRSYRRGLSFSNASFRRRSSSATSLHSPPSIGLTPTRTAPLLPAALLQPRHRSTTSTTSVDPSATHYQDPAAKLKLRVYLASPQKFDEAIEFGFPSLHTGAVSSSTRPKTSAGIIDVRPKTFLADDTPSLSEDERSEYFHQDSPRTPIEMSFPPQRPSQKSSTDRSTYFRPRAVHNYGDSYAHVPASDREMTLKMTLTRPELRALEDSEIARQTRINDMPLEKVPLTVPIGGSTSIWDDLPEEPSRFKRFFKKLKGRA